MLTHASRTHSDHRRRINYEVDDENIAARKVDHDASMTDPMLLMQQQHGNQHVQRILVQRDDNKAKTGADDKLILGTTAFAGKGHAMYQLAGRRSSISARTLNNMGLQLMGAASQLNDIDKKTEGQMTMIESKTGKGGKAALEKMAKSQGALTKAVGPSANYTNREISKNYLDAIGAAEASFNDLSLKRKDIDIAFSKIHEKAVKSKKLKAKRDVEQAEGEQAEEQKRVDDEKKYLSQIVDTAGKLADPTEWVGILVDAGTFIAKEIIEKNYTTDRLEQLKKKTEETKALLAGIEDEEILSEMKTAGLEMEKAKQAYLNQKKVFNEAMKKVRREEADMTKLLGKSDSTKGVAGAIKERSEMAATAVAASENIQFVIGGVPKVLAAQKDLDRMYDRVLSELPNPNVTMAINEQHAEQLKWLIFQNYHVTAQMKEWLDELAVVHQSFLDTLQTGAYFKGYDQIPDVLDESVAGKS